MKRLQLTAAFIILLTVSAFAAVPRQINYQGYLKQGGVVVSGTKNITFTLFDASSGGNQLCTSGVQSLTVTKGIVSYKIGSSGCDLSTINWDNPVYLELKVENAVMAPRELITGSAYTMETKAVNVEFTPSGGVAATDVQTAIQELDTEKLDKTGGTVSGNLNVTGAMSAVSLTGDGSGITGVVANGSVMKSGDTMTGNLNVNANLNVSKNITAATGTVTAQTFVGDGSALTGVTGTDNTKVLKAGDTMTGNLTVNGTLSATALSGDGSAITGVPATDNTKVAKAGDTMSGALNMGGNDISNAGTIAATSYTGSGAALTGINASTVSDNIVTSAKIVDGSVTASDLQDGAALAEIADDDGAGSGLDADLLDGQQGSYYMPSTTDNWVNTTGDTMTGNLSVTGTVAATALTGDGSGITGITATDNTKVLKSGDVMTGDLNVDANISVSGDITAATGTVTAQSFVGDGSLITGVTSTDNTRVLKAGDTMSGALNMGGNNISNAGTVTATAFSGDGSALTGVPSSIADNSITSLKIVDGSVTATDMLDGAVLTEIADDDGIGSGLDADLLDGQDSTAFMAASTDNWVNTTGDTMTGNLSVTGTVAATALTGDGSGITGITSTDNTKLLKAGDTMSGALNMGNQAISNIDWAASDDGSGSGLDADLLDGQQGTYYLNTGTTHAGDITGAYDNLQIAADAVTTSEIAAGAVGTSEIADGSVASIDITDLTVATGDVAFGFVGSLDGVVNKGGDIDLVAGSGMTIIPDDAGNQITLSMNMGVVDHGSISGLGDDDHTQYLLSAGDTMSGALNMGGNNISNAGTVAATSFSGSGVGLTGVTGTDSSKVAKSGDTMTGALGIGTSGATASISIYQTGTTDEAGYFEISNSSNTAPAALYATSNSVANAIRGVNTADTGIAGAFNIDNPLNTNSAVYTQTNGTGNLFAGNHSGGGGNLIYLNSGGVNQFSVDKSGNVFASGTLIAASFIGDGSGLSGVTASGAVQKIGDTMSGALAIEGSGATASLYANNAGTGMAAHFVSNSTDKTVQVSNTDLSVDSMGLLASSANGTGLYGFSTSNTGVQGRSSSGTGVYGQSFGSGYSIFGRHDGAEGSASYFVNVNPANTNASISANTNGIGSIFYGNHTGASGNLIKLQSGGVDKFVVDKSGNTYASGTITATSFSGDGSLLTGLPGGGDITEVTAGTGLTGGGASGSVTLNVADNYVLNSGDTMSGGLTISTPIAYPTSVFNVTNTGTGHAGAFMTMGDGAAGGFVIDNAANSYNVVQAYTNGTGNDYFGHTYGTGTIYAGNHEGASGNLIQLQSGGVDKFVVDKTGAVTATSFTGSGAGLTGITATDITKVAKTGDSMSGALGISQSGATASLYVYQKGTTDEAGYFEIDNAGSSANAVYAGTNGSGTALYASSSGTGKGVYGVNSSSGYGVQGDNTGSGTSVFGDNIGTGRAGHFRINVGGNSSEALFAETAGTGTLLGGNHTGASGNLIQLQSGGVDKFVVDKSGNVTAGGTVSGSCPGGMVSVTDFCVDNAPSTGSWIGMVTSCRTAGKRVCSMVELTMACQQGGIGIGVGGYYYVDEVSVMTSEAGALHDNGAGDCSSVTFTNLNMTGGYNYYCCINR